MKIALDPQLLMRTNARRMIFGAAELAGADVLVPETAAFFAKLHYHRVARRYVQNKVKWSAASRMEPIDETTLAMRADTLLEAATAGYAQWLDSEPLGNDAIMRSAPRTAEVSVLAMRISLAGVVVDDKDQRWAVGEDPYVLAEALEAGAHWIASENFATVNQGAMGIWLARMQDQGRFRHVPRPFILDAAGAVATLLTQAGLGTDRGRGGRDTVALAYALCEPKRKDTPLVRRLNILGGFAEDAKAGGMTMAGEEIAQWHREQIAMLETDRSAVRRAIERLQMAIGRERVQRTRDAEDRRLVLEQKTGTSPPARTPKQNPSPGREH